MTPALVAFLALLAAERIAEMSLSSRHAEILIRRGAVEFGARHFPLIVALHLLFPLALVAEVLWAGARPPGSWPWWLGLLLAAQVLRFATLHVLGEYWNVRIRVVPGMTPVRRGPYRFLRHPNYVAVVIELASAPMMFGAWRTALVFSAFNAAVLVIRIREEERALAWATIQREAAITTADSGATSAGTGSSTRSTSNVMSS